MLTRITWGLACVAALLPGCDDEVDEPVPVGPTGPPSLAFVNPASDGPQPVCVSIGDDPDFRVPLLVEATELVLRPPEACGAYAQCGHLALYVNGVLNNESGVPTIEVLIRKLGDRYHDGTPLAESGEPDVLHVVVELQDDEGQVLLDHDGEELSDSLELVTLADPCGNPPRQPPPDSP